jgi:hypothetical protein
MPSSLSSGSKCHFHHRHPKAFIYFSHVPGQRVRLSLSFATQHCTKGKRFINKRAKINVSQAKQKTIKALQARSGTLSLAHCVHLSSGH